MRTLTLAVLIGVLTACSHPSAQQARRLGPTETVATVDGVAITLADVDDKALEQPASNFGSTKLSQALYEARRAALDDIVSNRLMDAAAKAQKIERSALMKKKLPPRSRRSPTPTSPSGTRRTRGGCRARPWSRCGSRFASS